MNAFGIDLGTGNIKIYDGTHNRFFLEKNMIAIEGKKNLFAYGDSAFDMYEKTPGNINVSSPLSYGVIADIGNMQTLIKYFVNDLFEGNVKPADYYIAVPTDITDVEKRAFYELIKESNVKARKVMVVEKAIADGLGLDIDVKTSQGVLVVDVGYETTEISTLSLGGIVNSRLIKTAGSQFDQVIKATVRNEYNLVIGSKTAEKVKYSLRDNYAAGKDAIVYGQDLRSGGLPIEKAISTKLINDALQESFHSIIDNVKQILEKTPPELGADIYRHGIYLTGGASQIAEFDRLLSEETGLSVNITEEPMASVVKGLSTIIRDAKFNSLAYSIES